MTSRFRANILPPQSASFEFKLMTQDGCSIERVADLRDEMDESQNLILSSFVALD